MHRRSPKRVAARLFLVGAMLAGLVLPSAVPAQAAPICHTLMTKGHAFTRNSKPYSITLYASRCGTETQYLSLAVARNTAVKATMGTKTTADDLNLTSYQSHGYGFSGLANTMFTVQNVTGEPLSKAKIAVGTQIAPYGSGSSAFTSPAANPVVNDCKTPDGKVHRKHRNGRMDGNLTLNTNTAFGKVVVTDNTPATLMWDDSIECGGGGGGEPTDRCETNSKHVSGSRADMTISASKEDADKKAHLFSYTYGKLNTTRDATFGSVFRSISSEVPAGNLSMTFDAAGAPKTSSISGFGGTDIIGKATFTTKDASAGTWQPCPKHTSTLKQDRSDYAFGKITAPATGGLKALFFMGAQKAVSSGALDGVAMRSRVRTPS